MPAGWEPEQPLLSRLIKRGPLPWLAAEDRVKRLGTATEGVNLDRRQALIAAFLAVEQAAVS
jgi:hypothetical protein